MSYMKVLDTSNWKLLKPGNKTANSPNAFDNTLAADSQPPQAYSLLKPKRYHVFDLKAPSASQNKSSVRCRLLTLPGELRNQIYSYIIYPHQTDLICVHFIVPQDVFRGLLKSPIYRINQQIRAEALSFLCSKKTFTLLNVHTMVKFLTYIGPSGRANLSSLTFVPNQFWDARQLRGELLKLLRDLQGLKTFRLEFVGETRTKHMKLRDFWERQWHDLYAIRQVVEGLEGARFEWGIRGLKLEDIQLPEWVAKLKEFLGESYV